MGFGASPLHSMRPMSLAPASPAGQRSAGAAMRPSLTSQPAGTSPPVLIEQKMLPVGLVKNLLGVGVDLARRELPRRLVVGRGGLVGGGGRRAAGRGRRAGGGGRRGRRSNRDRRRAGGHRLGARTAGGQREHGRRGGQDRQSVGGGGRRTRPTGCHSPLHHGRARGPRRLAWRGAPDRAQAPLAGAARGARGPARRLHRPGPVAAQRRPRRRAARGGGGGPAPGAGAPAGGARPARGVPRRGVRAAGHGHGEVRPAPARCWWPTAASTASPAGGSSPPSSSTARRPGSPCCGGS